MIGSLLIANRGEIACRIIRTAARLGVRSVAVASDADRGAPHVRLADEAVFIGGTAAKDSYLAAQAIIDAAERSGAEAIHPGYGFLSENADFAEAVQRAGLIWVGPPGDAIRAMGLKDASKALMMKAGVPVTPGYLGDDQTVERLEDEAARIGYPILIKAVAGGGGKGMRKVDRQADFRSALASCRREAAASFGDDRVLLETYVQQPRHIEVQLFADTHGNVVHLFERDCSLQRRHQKVIEEAPAPGMTADVRRVICEASVRAAKAIGYQGAGTVEFIADGSSGLRGDAIYFMEMNTRLQVEHPVTELITGYDLVEWQLRVASGEPLPAKQDEIGITGCAMEARLYAEDPTTGFLPSIGPLTHFRLPSNARVDTGVEEGEEVTPLYDPMIAKIIVCASTRESAAKKLAAAAAQVEIWPVKTNAAFLAKTAAHRAFIEGHVHTGFITDHLDELLPDQTPTPDVLQSAAAVLLEAQSRNHDGFWADLQSFRLNAPASSKVSLLLASQDEIDIVADGTRPCSAILSGDKIVVFEAGQAFIFDRARSHETAAAEGGDSILAPMPGRIVALSVSQGETVTKGQALVTLEAMKMEHLISAPFDAVVEEVRFKDTQQVKEGDLLIKLSQSQ